MRILLICIYWTFLCNAAIAQDKPITLIMLGDSIAAGLGLPAGAALPNKLQQALQQRGAKVNIVNAGVAGDTLKGGLARFDWAVSADSDGVIVELGGNDLLRGIEAAQSQRALFAILDKAKQRRLPVLLLGLRAFRNFGEDYARDFEAIFQLATERYDIIYQPDFLNGIAGNPALNQPDGIHPSEAGVAAIVTAMLPKTEALIAVIKQRREN